MSEKSLSCKIVLLGDGGVGKTSLRRTYLGEGFRESYSMTIGADFAARRLNLEGWNITSNIWDLAGQHRFKKLRETYYRGVSGALLVYDITRPDTLTALPNWIEELKKNNIGKLVPMTVIANKADLRDEYDVTVSEEEGKSFTQELGQKYEESFTFVESSAKTGENVNKAFEGLIQVIFDRFIEHSGMDR